MQLTWAVHTRRWHGSGTRRPNPGRKNEPKIKDLGYNVYASTPDYHNPNNFNKNTKEIFTPTYINKDGTKKIYDFMLLCVPSEINFETNLIKL